MKIKLRWHKFLCWVFGHRWFYYRENVKSQFGPDLWRICKRCGKAIFVGIGPPEHPNCRCSLKLIIIITLVFFTGYFMRSIHYRQDSQELEKAQAELRTDVHEINRDFMPVVESAAGALEGYEDILGLK